MTQAAEAEYRRALQADPDNPELLHRLGILLADRGNHAEGLQLLQRAHQLLGDNAALLNSLGNAYRQMGRGADALEILGRALQLAPESAEALVNVGIVHHERGELQQAEDYYRRAIVLKPRLAMAHSNLGELLRARGRLAEARISGLNAVDFDPSFAAGHSNLANTLRMLGQHQEAEMHARRAIELAPGMADPHNNLAVVLHHQGRNDEAEASFRRAIELKPEFAVAWKNLGGLLHAVGRLEEGEHACRRALAIDPQLASAYDNLGLIYQAKGEIDKAEASFRQALALNPASELTQWNYSLLRLLVGDYEQGLRLYEVRFSVGAVMPNAGREQTILRALAPVPRWQGEPLAGKSLLLWGEQGLGDSIMALRYLPLVKARSGARILVYTSDPLVRLVRQKPEAERVLRGDDPIRRDEVDVHCPLMSLPFLFGTRVSTIPATVPYLSLPGEAKQRWAERLAGPGLKVGIAWAGNKSNPRDRLRSVALAKFEPLSRVPGVRLISLQKGAGEGDLREARFAVSDWMAECSDLFDTATLIASLDLVITVDTAVAHVAGALGKPVWLLNRFESEWRWMLQRDDSPWYPTLRIFRQPRLGDWQSVLERVGEALAAFAQQRRA